MPTPTLPQSIIDQFVGQKVEVTTQTLTHSHPPDNKEHTHLFVMVDPADPTIAALRKAAVGFKLRIFTPSNRAGTEDIRMDRLNVYIDQAPGKPGYEIARLKIG